MKKASRSHSRAMSKSCRNLYGVMVGRTLRALSHWWRDMGPRASASARAGSCGKMPAKLTPVTSRSPYYLCRAQIAGFPTRVSYPL